MVKAAHAIITGLILIITTTVALVLVEAALVLVKAAVALVEATLALVAITSGRDLVGLVVTILVEAGTRLGPAILLLFIYIPLGYQCFDCQ